MKRLRVLGLFFILMSLGLLSRGIVLLADWKTRDQTAEDSARQVIENVLDQLILPDVPPGDERKEEISWYDEQQEILDVANHTASTDRTTVTGTEAECSAESIGESEKMSSEAVSSSHQAEQESIDQMVAILSTAAVDNQPPTITSRKDLFDVLPETPVYTIVDGNRYFGMLCIPDYDLLLPVMDADEWKESWMDTAPCRYSGSLKNHDLIIMAHNYQAHFKPILQMKVGQLVYFYSLDGAIYTYRTAAVDIFQKRYKTKLYEGDWDMSLVTCVPNTTKRCAVRLILINIKKGE